ncbi:MAG: hypothetical protein Q7O66_04000 [Dehalococcoidia bacterium]|nr:hypothetical protein [Dehalococcoidia bacterium]
MATPSEIAQWAQGIGLPECIGTEFNADYGRLPGSLAELQSWGDRTGRTAGGKWSCLGTTTTKPPGSTTPVTQGIGQLQIAIDWIAKNPIPALLLGVIGAIGLKKVLK